MGTIKKFAFAFSVAVGFVSFVHAANTKFTNLEVTGTLTVDGRTTHTGQVTAGAPNAPYSRSIAQLNALAPGATGLVVYCSDCVRSALCVSSGTAAGAWTIAVSTAATPALTSIHCQ